MSVFFARAVRGGMVACVLAVAYGVAGRVDGVEMKAVDQLAVLRSVGDFERAPALPHARLVAPRNGWASGQVVVLCGEGEALPAISTSGFSGEAGPLVASTIMVRYATKSRKQGPDFEIFATNSDSVVTEPYFDVLGTEPPLGERLVPVWLTVRVGGSAAPGAYEATVAAGTACVTVRLDVVQWLCPAPAEWASHVGLLMSPETLAAHYGVALWSEEHWALVSKELEFAGMLGNDDLWLSIYPRNHVGQERSWISFKRSDEALVPDLSVVARYMDLYAEKVGTPHAVLVEMWNSGRYARGNDGKTPTVTIVVDGVEEKAPLPGMKGSEVVWRPLLDALRDEVVKRGWPESVLTIGCADDVRPDNTVVAFFKEHAPYAGWAVWTHGRGDPPPWKGRLTLGRMEVTHYEHLFCPWLGSVPGDGISGGWDLPFPEYSTSRNYLFKYAPPSQYRSFAEGNMVNIRKVSGKMSRSGAGFTRLPLDFWPVGDSELTARPLLLAYEKTPWSIFYRNNTRSLIEPGPGGPLGTVRYEMLREGLQECEARVQIERALVGEALPDALARSARELLKARINAREKGGVFQGGHPGNILGGEDRLWGVPEDWQESAARLFKIAGETR